MTRLLLLSLAVLVVPLRADAQCTQPRTLNVSVAEVTTGPYEAGDTFTAAFDIWTAGTESMGTSTMVVDFNDAALSFPSSPVKGTDYAFAAYDGFPRTTVNGAISAYNGEVRVTSSSRLTPFIELQFTADPSGEGEAIPTTPTQAFTISWTVVDPEAGFAITPRSQQFFNGPGGPTGCFDEGMFTGAEVGQREISGDAGWRMLGPPATGLTIQSLAGRNFVQGYPSLRPNATPNVLIGYDGSNFGANADPGMGLAPGTGIYWYLYNDAFTQSGIESRPLPMTLVHGGAAPLNVVDGGLLPNAVEIPLHASGNRWNLVSNPTSTPITVSGLSGVGGAFVEASVQVWEDAVGTTGGGSYVFASDRGGEIAPWQGFVVRNTDATGLSVPASARVMGPAAVKRVETDPMISFYLDGRSDDGVTLRDQATRLLIEPRAELGRDAYDVEKLAPLGTRYAALGFVGEDGSLRSQDAQPLGEDGIATDLAFEAAGEAGTYTLTWDLGSVPEAASVLLLDRETGETVNLREVVEYSFRAAATVPERADPLAVPALLGRSPLGSQEARFALAIGRPLPVGTEAPEAPETLTLAPPRPNPFRAETALEYSLPEAGPVRLMVFDLLGREVARLVDEERAAGVHRATFSPADLAAGSYVVRLEAGGEARVQRVTFVR
ncbi:MAG: T9SS type A sorting domain-containing protein [Bacteroidota bacterium]